MSLELSLCLLSGMGDEIDNVHDSLSLSLSSMYEIMIKQKRIYTLSLVRIYSYTYNLFLHRENLL